MTGARLCYAAILTSLLAVAFLSMPTFADEGDVEEVCCGQTLPPNDGSDNDGRGGDTGSSNPATDSKEAGDDMMNYSPCGNRSEGGSSAEYGSSPECSDGAEEDADDWDPHEANIQLLREQCQAAGGTWWGTACQYPSDPRGTCYCLIYLGDGAPITGAFSTTWADCEWMATTQFCWWNG